VLKREVERRADRGPHAGHGFGQQGAALVRGRDDGEMHAAFSGTAFEKLLAALPKINFPQIVGV
jgi:hypothetical protein